MRLSCVMPQSSIKKVAIGCKKPPIPVFLAAKRES